MGQAEPEGGVVQSRSTVEKDDRRPLDQLAVDRFQAGPVYVDVQANTVTDVDTHPTSVTIKHLRRAESSHDLAAFPPPTRGPSASVLSVQQELARSGHDGPSHGTDPVEPLGSCPARTVPDDVPPSPTLPEPDNPPRLPTETCPGG